MGPHRPRGDHWPVVGLEFIENYILYPDSVVNDPYGRARLEENLARFAAPEYVIGPPRPRGMCDSLTLEVSGFFSVSRLRGGPPLDGWKPGRCWDDVYQHRPHVQTRNEGVLS